jgi:hypothetical protein
LASPGRLRLKRSRSPWRWMEEATVRVVGNPGEEAAPRLGGPAAPGDGTAAPSGGGVPGPGD